MHFTPRVLFILKFRESYWGDYSLCDAAPHDTPETKPGLSSGLLNSAKFVKDMLLANGVEAKLVQVIDNNSIDREVTLYKPTHVIIEALWVVPEKFDILTKLHPHVRWIVRNHSETSFVANEGIAVKWLLEYIGKKHVRIANNSIRAQKEFEFLAHSSYPNLSNSEVARKVVYLPNYYPLARHAHSTHKKLEYHGARRIFDIGCFGAIRPLKNQLAQAVAALEFADHMNFYLRFHINGTRIEGKGDPILKNLRELFFKVGQNAELVEHPWMPHEDFLQLIDQMDMGLQVSYSETFNIVGADFVARGVPLVGSSEIPWLPSLFCADPNSVIDMVRKMKVAYLYSRIPLLMDLSHHFLKKYVRDTEDIWLDYFQSY